MTCGICDQPLDGDAHDLHDEDCTRFNDWCRCDRQVCGRCCPECQQKGKTLETNVPFRPKDWIAALCVTAFASALAGVAITKLADQPTPPAPEIYLVDPNGQPVTAGSTSVPVPAEIGKP